MPALVLLPPLPPEEPARGQQCFGFLDITIVVRVVVPRGPRKTPAATARWVDTKQLPLIPRPPKRRRPIRTYGGANGRMHGPRGPGVVFIGLTEFERAEMERDVAELEAAGVYAGRPVTWGDCPPSGPCGFVSCRANLYVTVDSETGSIRMNFPGKAIDEIGETCALRAAENGPMTDREVAKAFNIAHQRVHQIEKAALVKIRRVVAADPVVRVGRVRGRKEE